MTKHQAKNLLCAVGAAWELRLRTACIGLQRHSRAMIILPCTILLSASCQTMQVNDHDKSDNTAEVRAWLHQMYPPHFSMWLPNRHFLPEQQWEAKGWRITDAEEGLLRLLEESKTHTYEQDLIFVALRKFGTSRSVPKLVSLLNDPDPEVSRWAGSVLGDIGDLSAVEPLCLKLRNCDKNLAMAVCWSLRELVDTSTMECLREVSLDHKDPEVRQIAKNALDVVEAKISTHGNWNRR